MGLRKTSTLRASFWKFLLSLIAGLYVAVFISFSILLLSTTFGITTYANYSEQGVKNLVPRIAALSDLNKMELPEGCKYLILDKEYQVIKTTLEGDELSLAMDYAKTGKIDLNLNRQYALVTREKEFVIIQYYISSQFTNQWMNEHLPAPEIIMYILIALNCIIISIILTASFSKHLRLQLAPLFKATEEVAQRNLDFEVGHSKIKEFDEVLLSFSDMKDSLKTSLEQQWKTEQMQKEQIAALAHDLKTPLTVIQGNADLILETKLDEEQKRYADFIIDNTDKMQIYIKTIIDISKAVMGYQFHGENVCFSEYMEQLSRQIEVLCQMQKIHVELQITDIPSQLIIDRVLLERAIMNVVNNAIIYSPPEGTIFIHIIGFNDLVQIEITDQGKGFSVEALLHAKEQFYMEERSRNTDMHFGMGLYIADSIAQQHGGQLILENSKETGGAKVTIQIAVIHDQVINKR